MTIKEKIKELKEKVSYYKKELAELSLAVPATQNEAEDTTFLKEFYREQEYELEEQILLLESYLNFKPEDLI